jgi:hypothetical protein
MNLNSQSKLRASVASVPASNDGAEHANARVQPSVQSGQGGAVEESDERLGGKRRRETGELGKSSKAQWGEAEETFELRAKTYAACETNHSRGCDAGSDAGSGVGGVSRDFQPPMVSLGQGGDSMGQDP